MLDGLYPAMRDTVQRTLGTVIVMRVRTRTRSATGGSTYSWADAVSVDGRFMAVSNQEKDVAVRMNVDASHVAILPFDTVVAVDDRLEVGGVEYAVTGVMEHEIPVLIKVLCLKADDNA